MKRRRALGALSRAFRGEVSSQTDWMELVEAANRALVTPALYRALQCEGAAKALPEDAASFFAMVDERNNERNLRLRSLALDAVEALNAAGITPVFLKGMAVWATSLPGAELYPRMMSDVDLMVRPDEVSAAMNALLARGFKVLKRYDANEHGVADLWREDDVGVLDLHQRPPGPRALTMLFDPDAHTSAATWPGDARVPTSEHQIYLTCLHDMFHDGGFWRGGFDVRHLCDIAALTRGPAGVDWDAFSALLDARLTRNAVHSQLIAAQGITGALIPDEIARRIVARLHHRRHVAQYCHPRLGFPLGLLGIGLEALNLRQHWPYLGVQGLSLKTLLWWLSRDRVYPNKI